MTIPGKEEDKSSGIQVYRKAVAAALTDDIRNEEGKNDAQWLPPHAQEDAVLQETRK